MLEFWPHMTASAVIIADVVAVIHAVMTRRDSRAAAGWVTFVLLLPIVGAVLYVLLGVNRVRRRASALRSADHKPLDSLGPFARGTGDVDASLAGLVRLGDSLHHLPLVSGNQATLLDSGDEAFPAMLSAISNAQASITMATYIFDKDAWGLRFVSALGQAVARGVQVRVLIDGVGARYSFPTITRQLRRSGVNVREFLPPRLGLGLPFANLRNHRKLLVVDGTLGFTGGLNIRAGSVLADDPRHPTRDLHVRLQGPIVSQLQETFAEDWRFVAKESLDGPIWYPAPVSAGGILARGIAAGPDEDMDALPITLVAALNLARKRVAIVTPYFVPERTLYHALEVTALRGVIVDIIVPERSNVRLVNWAFWGSVDRLIEKGCRIWLSPAPFDHSKMAVVDGQWSLFGSANWDARSLRLNFEFCVEAYDAPLASEFEAACESRRVASKRLTTQMLVERRWLRKLRDASARLLTPYL